MTVAWSRFNKLPDLSVGRLCPDCKDGYRRLTSVDFEKRQYRCTPYSTFGYYGTSMVHPMDVAQTAPTTDSRFPHKCPNCGDAAYVGLIQVEHAHGGSCRAKGG